MATPDESSEASQAIAKAVARGDLIQQLGELIALLDRHATTRSATRLAAIALAIHNGLERIAAKYTRAELIALRRRDEQVEWLLNAAVNRLAREERLADPGARLLEGALLQDS